MNAGDENRPVFETTLRHCKTGLKPSHYQSWVLIALLDLQQIISSFSELEKPENFMPTAKMITTEHQLYHLILLN